MKRDPDSFSTRLREDTRRAHTAAETSTFITELMDGHLTAHEYVRLIAQYQPIYTALEHGAEQLRTDPRIAGFLDPALDRIPAINADLAGLLRWAELDELPRVVPAAHEYAARISDVAARGDSARFLAHHYLRYLGDLSGGQAIGARTARHYGVPQNLLTMWRFDVKPKPYKDAYRDLLDAAGPQLGEDVVIDEAAKGFGYNQAMFAQLEREPAGV